jgi:hypothetical protein
MTDLLEEFMFMFFVLINCNWEQIFALHFVVIVCKNGNILCTNFFPFEFVCTPTARAINEYVVRVLTLAFDADAIPTNEAMKKARSK